MPSAMASSSSSRLTSAFSTCNLRAIPQRTQTMLQPQVPGWRAHIMPQRVPKGGLVSPLQSSSHCWVAKKAGYQHGTEEDEEEEEEAAAAAAAKETLAGGMMKEESHMPLLDKFQQQLHDNDGSYNTGSSARSVGVSPAAGTGSVSGAVALITGTSVGAGILALPATTAPAGFVPSAVVMGLSWGFLVLEALLLAEVNVALMMQQRQTGEKLHSEVLSLRTMAEQTLGPLGGIFTTLTYLMLSYTLMVAYIAKAGEMLSLMFDVPISLGAAVFTFAFGGIICFGGHRSVDDINQALTVLLVGFFLLIVAGGTVVADWSGLEHMDWAMAPQTIPIMILALVYHDLTPVLCAHLGGDKELIRKSIILGSTVPLIMFLLWDALALCLVPISGSQDSVDVLVRFSPSSILDCLVEGEYGKYRGGLTVENTLYKKAIFIILQLNPEGVHMLIHLLNPTEHNCLCILERATTVYVQPWKKSARTTCGLICRYLLVCVPLCSLGGTGLAFVIESFSLLAVATSFIGTVLGLSEFLVEQLGKVQSSRLKRGRGIKMHQVVYLGAQPLSKWLKRNGIRTCATLLMLAPPLVASSIVSDAFFSASSFAGAYGMTSLYGVIPPAMAWSLHQRGSSLLSERSKEIVQPKTSQQHIAVPGGKLTLAGIGACACAVILGQIVLDLPQLSRGIDPNLVLTAGHQENMLNANTCVDHNL